jgi:LSM domain
VSTTCIIPAVMLCAAMQLGWKRADVLFHLQGTLRGYDQATNLILDDAVERVYSTKVSRSRTYLTKDTIRTGTSGC